ncbi:MAG: stage II sporulation protein M, partial [Oculatellaceae cyanobacterium Prado106]|nr:stage II sporulation protein M [Oculatellaceae cyanobacterium Prado106]
MQRWIARREQSWKELEALLKQVERRGIRSLKASEIQHLASLYRSVSGDLARARTQQLGNLMIQTLQGLTRRSYSQIYQGSRRQEWGAIVEFVLWGFPEVVRRSRGYIALGAFLLVGAGLLSYWQAWQDPTYLSLVVPEPIVEQVRDRQELWMGSIVGVEPFAAQSIMVNNIQVSFTALAGGLLAGLGTLYIMLLNGILIGAVASLVGQHQLAYPFWAFVFPHGALELPAIFMAAGAGFLLARAVLFPSPYRRLDALKMRGQQAAQLVFGIVPMLV